MRKSRGHWSGVQGSEAGVELAADVGLEGPDDLAVGLPLAELAVPVGACLRIETEPSEDHDVGGPVEAAVAARVDADGLARTGGPGDRGAAGEGGEVVS